MAPAPFSGWDWPLVPPFPPAGGPRPCGAPFTAIFNVRVIARSCSQAGWAGRLLLDLGSWSNQAGLFIFYTTVVLFFFVAWCVLGSVFHWVARAGGRWRAAHLRHPVGRRRTLSRTPDLRRAAAGVLALCVGSFDTLLH